MQLWILLVSFSALMSALVNHADKYLIEKYLSGRGIGSLMIFSTIAGIPFALVIALTTPGLFSLAIQHILLITLNGILVGLALIPYLYALESSEASMVAPLFQLSSVFALLLGFFVLGETLNLKQIVGGLIILISAVGLSFELQTWKQSKKMKLRTRPFLLMLISSFVFALNLTIFKVVAIESSFLITGFWEAIGLSLLSVVLIYTVPTYREEFMRVLRSNKSVVIGVNVFNEIINYIGRFALNYAALLTSIGMVSFVVEGMQPVFVLITGVVLTLLFPKLVSENITKEALMQKIIFIGGIVIGTYFISVS